MDSSVSSPARLKFLIKSLSALVNYYESLFTSALETDMLANKKEIEKELRDFIGIYKWQEANYWSIKMSVQKSNRVLLRTIRKFKTYLRSPVEFARLIRLAAPLPASNHRFLVDYFKINEIERENVNDNDDGLKYSKRMHKLTRKLLTAKFAKNRLNRSVEMLTGKIEQRYAGLEKETKMLNSRFAASAKDKEALPKLKKEFKYLNQEKLKFVSDTIKELTAIGNI